MVVVLDVVDVAVFVVVVFVVVELSICQGNPFWGYTMFLTTATCHLQARCCFTAPLVVRLGLVSRKRCFCGSGPVGVLHEY